MGYLGSTVMAEVQSETANLQGQDAERKARAVMDKWFGDSKKPHPGQFADPALMFG